MGFHLPVPVTKAGTARSRNHREAARVIIAIGLQVLLVGTTYAGSAGGPAGVSVDAHFPGGNIVVERIEGDAVYLRPDLRDTEGWWFYWSFHVRGVQGRTLTFRFSGGNPIGVRGPAVSTDDGRT